MLLELVLPRRTARISGHFRLQLCNFSINFFLENSYWRLIIIIIIIINAKVYGTSTVRVTLFINYVTSYLLNVWISY